MKTNQTLARNRSIAVIVILIALTALVGHSIGVQQAKTEVISRFEVSLASQTAINQELSVKLKVATASGQPVRLTDKQAKGLIAIVIPDKSSQDRFFSIVKNCENSTLDPTRVNINKDGSFDLGFSQVNSIHRQRVEAMFGESFETAMSDSAKNILYSAYLHQHQGFTPWSCNSKI